MHNLLNIIKTKSRLYFPLIKSLQTGLLMATGFAGFMSSRCPFMNWQMFLGLGVSLFLSISGSTVLNMWYDRDIDAKMKRTSKRPSSSNQINPQEVLVLGLVLSTLGIGIALLMNPLYGLIIFAGVFFDVVIYTMWLKRRTCWSIVWGGIAGGMPILAGRTLGVGHIAAVGILLSLAILFWIPTHILTFSIRYADDYRNAGVPTFPSTYGNQATRIIIAISSVLATLAIGIAAYLVGTEIGYLRLMFVLSSGLLILAVVTIIKPSKRLNFGLFKYASIYMLSAMLLLSI